MTVTIKMDIFSKILITFVPCLFTTATSWQSYQECENCGCCDTGKDLCLYQNLNCTTCLDGYWGEKCRNICPANCLACMEGSEGLYVSTNICTKCEDGRYLDNQSTCRQCRWRCKTCTSFNICKECKTGYYLFNNRCKPCHPKCTACLSLFVCTSCISAHYGTNCEQECSGGCQADKCDKSTGACTCKTAFTGQMCDQCVDTFYGQDCNLKCSTLCKDQICLRETGICVNCVHGRHGDFCNQSCSRGCKSGICHRKNGKCINESLHIYSDKDSNVVTIDEFVKRTALAIVGTFILTLCVTVALLCFLRFLRRRRENSDRRIEEQTAESYATLSSRQTNTETDYDAINRDSNYNNQDLQVQ